MSFDKEGRTTNVSFQYGQLVTDDPHLQNYDSTSHVKSRQFYFGMNI